MVFENVHPDPGVVFNGVQTSYEISEIKLSQNGQFLCSVMNGKGEAGEENYPLWYGINDSGNFMAVFDFSPTLIPVYGGEDEGVGEYGHMYYQMNTFNWR